MTDETRVFLTADEAIAMLPDGDSIHVLSGGAGMMIGADWKRESVITMLKSAPENGIELSGEVASRLNHRIACFQTWQLPGYGRYRFIETKQESPHD